MFRAQSLLTRRGTCAAVAIAVLLLGASSTHGQATAPSGGGDQATLIQDADRLSPEQMRGDLDYLVDKITQVHPVTVQGLPAALVTAIESARNGITPSLERDEFWGLLSRVLVSLHDAHSQLRRPPSNEQIDLPITWLDDGIIVLRDTAVLRRGDRVVSIGGCSEAELLAKLRSVVSAENDYGVKADAETLLPHVEILRALGVASGAPIEVEVERAGNYSTFVLSRIANSKEPGAKRPWVRWEIDSAHRLAVFTLDACTFDELYRHTVQEFFAAVDKSTVTRIAVDLRRNGGGNSLVINEFLRYLDVPNYRGYEAEIRYSADAIAQKGHVHLLGYQRFISEAPTPNPPPDSKDIPRFTGKVYILTSGETFSSGNWFAVICQDNGIGEVVGEPTGNAPSSFGDVLRFTLPESGWTFTLSYKKFLRPDPAKDPADALLPDHEIPLTRADVLAGRDPVLDYLRNPVDD